MSGEFLSIFTGFAAAVFATLILSLMFVVVVMGYRKVPQGKEYTVERLGRYTKTLKPGPNFVIPFLDSVSNQVDMRERVLDIPAQHVITNDNVRIEVDCIVYFQVLNAAKMTYGVEDLLDALEQLSVANVRSAIGKSDLDELLNRRENVADNMMKNLDDATGPWGLKVLRIKIQKIEPPPDLVEAMNKQMRADREKTAAKLNADAYYETTIKRAQGDKEAAIQRAEGKKEETLRLAEATSHAILQEAEAQKQATIMEAEARIEQAKAEAEATFALSQALNKGNVQALNYFIAEKYVDALKALAAADNQKVILMPLEASNVIGALGGVGELAKEAFQPKEK